MNESQRGIHKFLAALFESESGGKSHVINQYGYLGKYQFGEDALVDIGYYKSVGSKNISKKGSFKYDWTGKWTGKNGATSTDAFLSSPEIQDQAARDWIAHLCKLMHHFKLDVFIGKTIGGIEITESGVIAAAHLKGFGNAKHPGVIAFLKSDGTTCEVSCDHIPRRSWALFRARDVMRGVIESFKAEQAA